MRTTFRKFPCEDDSNRKGQCKVASGEKAFKEQGLGYVENKWLAVKGKQNTFKANKGGEGRGSVRRPQGCTRCHMLSSLVNLVASEIMLAVVMLRLPRKRDALLSPKRLIAKTKGS